MELSVRLEPQAVAGEVILIDGWICGSLMPLARNEPLITEWGDKRLVRRKIENTEDFVGDYANLQNIAYRAVPGGRSWISVVRKYGVFGYNFTRPDGLPERCAKQWRKTEEHQQVPFALPVARLTKAAKKAAALLELSKALREDDPIEILLVTNRLTGQFPASATPKKIFQGMPGATPWDIGSTALEMRVSSLLRDAARYGVQLSLDRRSDTEFVLVVSTYSLDTALLLAFCDKLGANHRRCKTCGNWFAPQSTRNVRCSRQCRTRASVYMARAIEAVKSGKPLKVAAKRYQVPESELRERIRSKRQRR